MRRKLPDLSHLPPLPPDRDDPCWVQMARENLENEYGNLVKDDWRVLRGEVEWWSSFVFSARYLRHRVNGAHRDAMGAWFREVQAMTGWDRATVRERLRDV